MVPTINQDVLIIGAGLGGLALAQVLQANGIPFQIFERDVSLHARKQGWAIALDKCLERLTESVSPTLGDIYSVSVNASLSSVHDAAAIVDSRTGTKIALKGGVPRGQPGHILLCRRDVVRSYLSQSLQVTTGKIFSNYIANHNAVTAFFEDGTSVSGSMLVGFDGASSRVRSQLLCQTARAAPYIPIMGNCTLKRTQFEHLHALGSAGIVAGGPDLRYVVGLLKVAPDMEQADYYYAVCYKTTDPEGETTRAQTATQQELFDKAVALTKDMPEFLTEIIHTAGPNGILTPPLKFIQYSPPLTLPLGRVTLAGDAAHTMMPFRGAGANTAILDACDLAQLTIVRTSLGKSLSEKEVVNDLLQQYNSIMCRRGRAGVDGSKESAEDISKILGVNDDGPSSRKVD